MGEIREFATINGILGMERGVLYKWTPPSGMMDANSACQVMRDIGRTWLEPEWQRHRDEWREAHPGRPFPDGPEWEGTRFETCNLEIRETLGFTKDQWGDWESNGCPWVINKSTYAGTLPKRVARILKKNGYKFTAQEIAEFGERARRFVDEGTPVYLDRTTSIDWGDGDFGDEGSCYWGTNSGARDALMADGGGAFRVWIEGEGYHYHRIWHHGFKGVGRVWYVVRNNRLVLWNAYGRNQLLWWARALATAMGLDYKKVDLTNNGDTGGLVYINCGGYVVGKDANSARDSLDLEGETRGHGGDYDYYCNACDTGLDGDDVYWVQGDAFCENCAQDADRCEHCEEMFWNDSLNQTEDGHTLCNRCYRNHTTKCDNCRCVYYDEEMSEVVDEQGYTSDVCSGCFESATHCDKHGIDYTGEECPNCKEEEDEAADQSTE